MGGSEMALFQTSRALAKRGHTVRVVANLGPHPEGVYEGVTYTTFPKDSCDALIYFRGSFPLAHPVSARRRVWWSTDAYLEGDYWPDSVWPKVDSAVCISDFHRNDLMSRWFNQLPSTTVIPLGCDPDEQIESFKVGHRLIYCSEPARGLEHLLRAWPRIRAAVPDASLAVTFDYRLWNSDPKVERFRALAQQEGIDYYGLLPRRSLLEQQAAAELHCYPCTFPENFCLASLECQLQGTPTITTNIGALPETVKTGCGWVTPSPQGVIDTTIAVLKDRPVLNLHSLLARESALTRTWTHSAAAWEAFLSA
jgi:glycosyltransferase involved in cell wall biosynthesis